MNELSSIPDNSMQASWRTEWLSGQVSHGDLRFSHVSTISTTLHTITFFYDGDNTTLSIDSVIK